MTTLNKNAFSNYIPFVTPSFSRSYSVAIICMYSKLSLFNRLVNHCKPFSVAGYDGITPPPGGIVSVYNLALSSINADFFLFCHHDIHGDIPSFILSCLNLPPSPNIFGCVGKSFKGKTYWKNATKITEVSTLDECLFGFFSRFNFTFDPNLIWTNYSQDICCFSKSKGGKSLVIPNLIDHSPNIHSSFFAKSGIFKTELAYVHKKWGAFRRT